MIIDIMGFVITDIAPAIISIGIALLIFLVIHFFKKPRVTYYWISPGERIQTVVDKLSNASKEVDDIIHEITTDLETRKYALAELQAKNKELAVEEEILNKRLKVLKETPIEVAQYFQELNQRSLEAMEKRNVHRDMMMFVLGIAVTTVVTIFLKLAGLS